MKEWIFKNIDCIALGVLQFALSALFNLDRLQSLYLMMILLSVYFICLKFKFD